MARRGFGGGGNNDEVSLAMTVCSSQLQQLANRVKSDCKDFSAERTLAWKEEILSLTKQVAIATNTSNTTRQVIMEGQMRARENNGDTVEMTVERMTNAILASSEKFNASEALIVRAVAGIVKIGDDDEEIEMMDQEIRDSHFTCPYTAVRMIEPMKNGQCIHRVSRIALTNVIKTGKCLVPGCNAQWTIQNAKPDPAFQQQMDEYFKSKASNQASSAQASASADDGYTQL